MENISCQHLNSIYAQFGYFLIMILPTVTLKVQVSLATLPASSEAVQMTVVTLFSSKVDPEGGSHDTARFTFPSVAVGSSYSTVALLVSMLSGQPANSATGEIVSVKQK